MQQVQSDKREISTCYAFYSHDTLKLRRYV